MSLAHQLIRVFGPHFNRHIILWRSEWSSITVDRICSCSSVCVLTAVLLSVRLDLSIATGLTSYIVGRTVIDEVRGDTSLTADVCLFGGGSLVCNNGHSGSLCFWDLSLPSLWS